MAFGNNPDCTFSDYDFAIWVTRVIDVASFILQGLAVNIIAVIEVKDILVSLTQAFNRFFLGNSLTEVLNNPGALLNRLGSKESFAGNAGCPNPNSNLHALLTSPLDVS